MIQGWLLLPHLLERTDNMKKIRSYTSIWSVEKVLYSINDFKLPFPITFTQMAWFVMSVFAVMLLGNLPPLSFIDGAFLKYFGVPFALTWFMCQKTFDGKKPYGFLKSVLALQESNKLMGSRVSISIDMRPLISEKFLRVTSFRSWECSSATPLTWEPP